MNKGGRTEEERMSVGRALKRGGGLKNGLRDRSLLKFVRDPTIWSISILWGRNYLITVELSTKNVTPVSMMEKFIPNLESYLSRLVTRKDWKKALWFLGVPRLGVRRALERLVRGLRAPGVLKCVIVFLSTSWIFAIGVETGRGLVLFRGLHLLKLNNKDFSGLPLN